MPCTLVRHAAVACCMRLPRVQQLCRLCPTEQHLEEANRHGKSYSNMLKCLEALPNTFALRTRSTGGSACAQGQMNLAPPGRKMQRACAHLQPEHEALPGSVVARRDAPRLGTVCAEDVLPRVAHDEHAGPPGHLRPPAPPPPPVQARHHAKHKCRHPICRGLQGRDALAGSCHRAVMALQLALATQVGAGMRALPWCRDSARTGRAWPG